MIITLGFTRALQGIITLGFTRHIQKNAQSSMGQEREGKKIVLIRRQLRVCSIPWVQPGL